MGRRRQGPARPPAGNPKAAAWDRIGGLYWNANYRGGPAPADIDAYLDGVAPGALVAVVGASTRFLVGAALERGASVTVLDFSQRMCDALASVVAQERCRIVQHDITTPVPAALVERHDLVLADRLINRFTEPEALPALAGMLRLVRDGGEIRTAIRLGLYERDRSLILEGRRRGTLHLFFDEATCEIDYSKARDILAQHLEPHGDIPRDVLLEFYALRGPEKRLTGADVERLVAAVAVDGRGLEVAASASQPVTAADTLYRLRPRRRGVSPRPPG